MTVIKRDGTTEEFSEKKIFDAIKKANNKCNKENRITDDQIDKVVKSTKNFIGKIESIDVDNIHKCVENALMKNNCFDVAKQYILFRQERDKERFKKFNIVQEMKEKLDASNVQNQNANLDEHSFGGRKGEMDSTVLKQMALDYYISPKFAKNHINNRIYIHDLDSYVVGMHNCSSKNTSFYTKDGIKTFENFNDGDITEVLCKDGIYRQATVRYYGKRQMISIIFKRGNTIKKVEFTPDHRWILKDGTVTTDIKPGDQIYILDTDKNRENWIVEEVIRELHKEEQEAWCVEEPVTHSFTLTENLVTGNCLSLPLDELLKKGANTRQAFIRPAGSVNTAFQLMAVFFQLQSLQQFGGVAATHVDWSFVPYVRKSFMKHFKDGLKYVEGKSDKEIENIINNEILADNR